MNFQKQTLGGGPGLNQNKMEKSPHENKEGGAEEQEQKEGKIEEKELKKNLEVPSKVKRVLAKIEEAGHEAYIVGGPVRDQFTEHEPHDWDLASSAERAELEEIFSDSTIHSENEYGTVTVVDDNKPLGSPLRDIEVTPYRAEEYSKGSRDPDVEFIDELFKDLKRRDFTINAMAIRVGEDEKKFIADPFNGRGDIKREKIKAVGDAEKRFDEDALRIIRGVRFASKLDFEIEKDTKEAIKSQAELLDQDQVSNERIRDELLKMLKAENPQKGARLLEELDLLKYVASKPGEGREAGGYKLNDKTLAKLKFASENDLNQWVKTAILFGNIEKKGGEAKKKRTEKINQLMETLKFSNDEIERCTKLARNCRFEYKNKGRKGLRQLAKKLMKEVGREKVGGVIDLREALEKKGEKEYHPEKLDQLREELEEIKHDPIEIEDLNISGNEIKGAMAIKEGPKVGDAFNILMAEVFEKPSKNKKSKLMSRARALRKLDKKELTKKSQEARHKLSGIRMAEI